MMLWEQGRLQLDDPVHKFIPSWRDQRVFVGGNHPAWKTTPAERPMTVRDLLSHTSGLTYGFMERTNVDAAYRKLGVADRTRSGYTARDMVEELAPLPLEFSPGTRWNYSVSTDVVGHLIELISGQRLDAYLREHVLQPLGMADTSFVVTDEQSKRFAANYQRQADDSLKLIDDPTKSIYRDCAFFSGGGGLVSTAHDYFRFASMMLNKGELDGIRLLGRKTVELMTMNQLPDGQDLTDLAQPGMFTETAYAGVGFGLGFSVMQSPARAQIAGTAGEFAWGGAAGTAFWIDPGEQMIAVFMTQIMQMGLPAPYPLRRELRTLAYSAVIE
jgi:CubicO group peptidase (beta-lactamase class C family)